MNPIFENNFFVFINNQEKPEPEDFNDRLSNIYKNVECYISEEKNLSALKNFKDRLVKKLIDFDENPSMTTSNIISIAKSQCCKSLIERIDSKITENRLKQNREKTEKIQEKMVRYMIDPELQVQDIMNYVDSLYENNPLQSTYNLAKEIIKNKNADFVPEEKKTYKLSRILAAMCSIELLRQSLKPYKDPKAYHFNPMIIKLIGSHANALISFDMLNTFSFPWIIGGSKGNAIHEMEILEKSGNEIINDWKGQPLSSLNSLWSATSLSKYFKNSTPFLTRDKEEIAYKYLYPIILCGNLGIYTFKASVYALANDIALLGLSRSERGVHGGLYKDPLALFMHDVIHHINIIQTDNPLEAAKFLNFSKSLFETIDKKIPENEQEFFYFGAHMLLHEQYLLYATLKGDERIHLNPVLSEILEAFYCATLKSIFDFLNLKSNLEPWEIDLRKHENSLQFSENRLRSHKNSLLEFSTEKDNKETQSEIDEIEIYINRDKSLIDKTEKGIKETQSKIDAVNKYKNSSKIEDNVLADKKIDPFAFDLIESLLYVTNDSEQKSKLTAKILPGLPEFSNNLNDELKQKYSILEDTDKSSENYKKYLKDYNSQLYTYQTLNYNPVEAYKALRDFLSDFKSKIKPYLEEIDKIQGPITDQNYKNVWEKGLEL